MTEEEGLGSEFKSITPAQTPSDKAGIQTHCSFLKLGYFLASDIFITAVGRIQGLPVGDSGFITDLCNLKQDYIISLNLSFIFHKKGSCFSPTAAMRNNEM